MSDNRTCEKDVRIPDELRCKLPRRIRLAPRGIYYLVANILFVAFMLLLVAMDVSVTLKLKRNLSELGRDGRIATTAEVRAGGMHHATVYYSFVYNGQTYNGQAFLPDRYSNLIPEYKRSGKFQVLFLPRNPSINHPNDWRDDESYSVLSYVCVGLSIMLPLALIKALSGDLKLARYGIATTARVTGSSRGRNGGLYLSYEFRDGDELLTTGRGEYPVKRKRDEQICILYLPLETWKSRPYPLVFFRSVK